MNIGFLYRRTWHTASSLMVVAFAAFVIIAGAHWIAGHSLQRGLTVGLVFPITLGSVSGVIEARAGRARRRIRTFTRGNLRASLFAGAWGAAWSLPLIVVIGIQEGTLRPYWETALLPLLWGSVHFLGAALPAFRS